MDRTSIEQILAKSEEDIKYIESISNKIIASKTADLDELMMAIQQDVVIADNPSDQIIESYFLELTNALYFVNTKCEFLGFYEDLSKSNAKIKYNQAYSENQIRNANNNIKTTVNDNVLYAENESINETLVNLIYSRSFRIIKVKVDAAQEMVKTLSKLISAHMQERQLSMYGRDNQNASGYTSQETGGYY